MAKQQLPPPMASKPRRKSKYSEDETEDETEDEGCGCDEEHENGIMLKISVLLPSMLQPKD
jgi:hypothetical protein